MLNVDGLYTNLWYNFDNIVSSCVNSFHSHKSFEARIQTMEKSWILESPKSRVKEIYSCLFWTIIQKIRLAISGFWRWEGIALNVFPKRRRWGMKWREKYFSDEKPESRAIGMREESTGSAKACETAVCPWCDFFFGSFLYFFFIFISMSFHSDKLA